MLFFFIKCLKADGYLKELWDFPAQEESQQKTSETLKAEGFVFPLLFDYSSDTPFEFSICLKQMFSDKTIKKQISISDIKIPFFLAKDSIKLSYKYKMRSKILLGSLPTTVSKIYIANSFSKDTIQLQISHSECVILGFPTKAPLVKIVGKSSNINMTLESTGKTSHPTSSFEEVFENIDYLCIYSTSTSTASVTITISGISSFEEPTIPIQKWISKKDAELSYSENDIGVIIIVLIILVGIAIVVGIAIYCCMKEKSKRIENQNTTSSSPQQEYQKSAYNPPCEEEMGSKPKVITKYDSNGKIIGFEIG